MTNGTQIFIAIATRVATGTCSGGLLKPLPILRPFSPGLDTAIAIDTKFALPGGLLKMPVGLEGNTEASFLALAHATANAIATGLALGGC